MKKFLLIPDSFKGTMSSSEICTIMEKAVLKNYPDATVIPIPVADGGEGSVDAFLMAMGGEKIPVTVKGPYFDDIESFYGVIDNGKTAIIEMAACAGLPLVGDNMNPSLTTTYGVGQLLHHAIDKGCKKIIMGLGGSCTNDGGVGAAAAGGMGCGMVAFFGSKLQMGIETVLDTVGFDEIVKDVDFVLSGEGKIDTQSLRGKVVIGIAHRTKKVKVPLIAIVGDIGDVIDEVYEMGVSGIFSINRIAVEYKEAKKRAKDDLYLTVDNVMKFIKNIER